MVREAVDTALTQLTANGGGTPQQAAGYSHPARTAEEIKATVADRGTAVPPSQQAVTDGMPADLAEIVNKRRGFPGFTGDTTKLVIPEKKNGGWKF